MAERIGRPSKYTEDMGGKVVALMSEGLSLTAAMAELGFHRDTAYEWQAQHKDFSDAVKVGQAKRQLFLERRLMAAEIGPVVTSSIFALKNTGTGDWRDKQDVEHSGPDGKPIQIQRIERVIVDPANRDS
ncbi:MAG TPA: hypothetical protein VNQ99_12325 [Xanthobacteraceae bacterium]|nr:hypothetical protein [Xanthobacteraceae bacterium]